MDNEIYFGMEMYLCNAKFLSYLSLICQIMF